MSQASRHHEHARKFKQLKLEYYLNLAVLL